MLINNYGINISISLQNGEFLERTVSSFKDFPIIRLEQISSFSLKHNGKSIFEFNSSYVEHSATAIRWGDKALGGWPLSYYIFRKYPLLFEQRKDNV